MASDDKKLLPAVVPGVVCAGILGYLLKKSGVLDSGKEAIMRKLNSDRLVQAPGEGTPILVAMACGTIEHTGIFLGNSRVAELTGNGKIQEVTLSKFINGDENDIINPRTGTRIFVACDDATGKPLTDRKIADNARNFIENVGHTDYNLFLNNCHLFTASCVIGDMQTALSIVYWLVCGTFSIDCVTDVISRIMNDKKKVAWLGVERPTLSFNYSLTPEKITRLYREGKILPGTSAPAIV